MTDTDSRDGLRVRLNVILLLSLFIRINHVDMCSNGMRTQKINDLLWFFSIGLSGENGKLNLKDMSGNVKLVEVKTLETILKDNNHTEARFL